jgi:hypothetical protein
MELSILYPELASGLLRRNKMARREWDQNLLVDDNLSDQEVSLLYEIADDWAQENPDVDIILCSLEKGEIFFHVENDGHAEYVDLLVGRRWRSTTTSVQRQPSG